MARGKVNTVPVRDGYISKVYLAAYSKRQIKYRLAGIINKRRPSKRGGPGAVANPEMVGKAVKNHSSLFNETKEGVLSRPEPLLNQIEMDLRNRGHVLSPTDKAQLRDFLDSEGFRGIVGICISDFSGMEEYSSPLELFYHLLGMSAYLAGVYGKFALPTGSSIPTPALIAPFIEVRKNTPELIDTLAMLLPETARKYLETYDLAVGKPFELLVDTARRNRWQAGRNALKRYYKELGNILEASIS